MSDRPARPDDDDPVEAEVYVPPWSFGSGEAERRDEVDSSDDAEGEFDVAPESLIATFADSVTIDDPAEDQAPEPPNLQEGVLSIEDGVVEMSESAVRTHLADETDASPDPAEASSEPSAEALPESSPGQAESDSFVPAAEAVTEPFSVDKTAEGVRIEAMRGEVPSSLPEETTDDDVPIMIEFENVSKRFRQQTVLRNLSFRVKKGETVCLIGESGCGKTVNLKLMIGLIRPDQGHVRFKGDDLARMNEKRITATRIKFGFLFQMAALFDSMSIYDNVAFGLREHRLMDEAAMPDYIRERLAEVGLPPGVEWKKPAELSGGQRKRVGLARALALKPEVMLYDEPTTGLDPIMTDIINELILQTQADKSRSGIIVTHEMRTVTKCADRVIMLYPISRLGPDESQILYDGPANAMEDHPDPRVRQFVRGEAGERLREMNLDRVAADPAAGIVPMDTDDLMKSRPSR